MVLICRACHDEFVNSTALTLMYAVMTLWTVLLATTAVQGLDLQDSRDDITNITAFCGWFKSTWQSRWHNKQYCYHCNLWSWYAGRPRWHYEQYCCHYKHYYLLPSLTTLRMLWSQSNTKSIQTYSAKQPDIGRMPMLMVWNCSQAVVYCLQTKSVSYPLEESPAWQCWVVWLELMVWKTGKWMT